MTGVTDLPDGSFRLEPRRRLAQVAGRFIRPPLLKADAESVTYVSGSGTVVVPRAELSMIVRARLVRQARYTAWVQSHLFGVARGKVVFAVPAIWFRQEDVAEFAQRLRVPLRGDFSERVTGAILHRPHR